MFFFKLHCQVEYSYNKKNGIDFLLLSNRAILNLQYNRTLFYKDKITVELSPSTGYSPGSKDKDTIPSFAHVGIGTNVYFGKYNKFGIGIGYSGLLKIGDDKQKTEIKKFSNAIIADVSYILWLDNEGPYLKFIFSPVLIGDENRKKNNFPFGFSIGTKF